MFFTATTIEELRKEYKVNARKMHPDMGGNAEDFKAMKNEYDELCKKVKRGSNGWNPQNDESVNIDAKMQEVIDQLVTLDIEIEICGTWIWLSGNTFDCKDRLKEFGCKWAKKKGMWYWNDGSKKRKRSKTISMDKIRNIHGSAKVVTKGKFLN